MIGHFMQACVRTLDESNVVFLETSDARLRYCMEHDSTSHRDQVRTFACPILEVDVPL